MRFDENCKNCVFFRGSVPNDVECANNDGSAWDPESQACNNFAKKK